MNIPDTTVAKKLLYDFVFDNEPDNYVVERSFSVFNRSTLLIIPKTPHRQLWALDSREKHLGQIDPIFDGDDVLVGSMEISLRNVDIAIASINKFLSSYKGTSQLALKVLVRNNEFNIVVLEFRGDYTRGSKKFKGPIS